MGLHQHLPPLCIAPETWLVRRWDHRDGDALGLQSASLVVRGREPALIDCGPAADAAAWLADIEAIVDPADVRWVLVTHDDGDHAGNLDRLLDACTGATVVTSRLLAQRVAPGVSHRVRALDEGGRLALADRELVAVTPPVVDNATTVGFFDTATRVLWAADCFGTPSAVPVADIDELSAAGWADATMTYHRQRSPWTEHVDAARHVRAVRRVARLDADVLATAHGPAIRGTRIARALDLVAALASPRTSP